MGAAKTGAEAPSQRMILVIVFTLSPRYYLTGKSGNFSSVFKAGVWP
jgi:hypothetical protein